MYENVLFLSHHQTYLNITWGLLFFLILNISHTHNYTQKWHFIWIPSKPNTISHDQGFSRKAFLNIDPMDVTIHNHTGVH